ncbi:hypothetical protein ACFHYQ_19930 [Sphaerimonospora cavernae]|uniref:Uncharacterized protein n=1 Tax=Sphaerimonospora cavernae TaxID=1740611 RepID=A0ABV6U7Y1_9ACTN
MNQTAEANKLIRLLDALIRLGIVAELRDNNTALMVSPPGGRGLPVWVFVGYGGAYFSWQSAEKRRPMADVAGAAQVLAAYVRR